MTTLPLLIADSSVASFSFAQLRWIDWVIAIVVLSLVFSGFARGFFRTVCSVVGLFVGLGVASWNYQRLAVRLAPALQTRAVADAIAFLLIVIAVMIVAMIIGNLLAKAFRMIGLGWLDRLFGGVVGFFWGATVVTMGVLVLAAFYPQVNWFQDSYFAPYFMQVTKAGSMITPNQLGVRIRDGLKTLEHDSPKWLH